MKKIVYEEQVAPTKSQEIKQYKNLIKEALAEREIYAVVFSNAPTTDPDSDFYECYELLTFVNGQTRHAQLDEEWYEQAVVLTKEEFENGALAKIDEKYDTQLEEAFKTAEWTNWDATTSAGWDSLYYCLCEAINEACMEIISLNKWSKSASDAQEILTNNGIESSLCFDCGSSYLTVDKEDGERAKALLNIE